MILMFVWNFNQNLNNGTWSYHLLNHLGFNYTLMNACSVMYTVILLCTQNSWKKILRSYSWVKTFGISILIFVPTEFIMFSLQPGMVWMYVGAAFFQNLMSVGMNFSYSNILYMNLTEENSTAHIAFNTIGCNLFAFLGMMVGTYVASLTGDDTPIQFLGMPTYAVQFTTLMRALFMTIMGIIFIVKWRSFTRDQDIIEIEEQDAIRRNLKQNMKNMPGRFRFPRFMKRA